MSQQPHVLAYGDMIKFTGGKYNGFEGYVAKIDLTTGVCSVMVDYENKQVELVEHFSFFKLLKAATADYTHDTANEDEPESFPTPVKKVGLIKRFFLRFARKQP